MYMFRRLALHVPPGGAGVTAVTSVRVTAELRCVECHAVEQGMLSGPYCMSRLVRQTSIRKPITARMPRSGCADRRLISTSTTALPHARHPPGLSGRARHGPVRSLVSRAVVRSHDSGSCTTHRTTGRRRLRSQSGPHTVRATPYFTGASKGSRCGSHAGERTAQSSGYMSV